MTDGMTDHFSWAEACSARLDKTNRIDKADAQVVAAHGLLHAVLAVADQLDCIRELIETATEPAETVQEHPWTKMDVSMRNRNVDQGRMTADEPYPGP